MNRSMAVLALIGVCLVPCVGAQQSPGQPTGQPGQPGPEQVMMRHLFPPELVMQHQGAINLSDTQRSALSAAIQQAQAKLVDVQWKLSGQAEKLMRLLQEATVDEAQVLEQVDRILALEREVKRAQMGLMVKIKNTLTAAQQEQLRQLRG